MMSVPYVVFYWQIHPLRPPASFGNHRLTVIDPDDSSRSSDHPRQRLNIIARSAPNIEEVLTCCDVVVATTNVAHLSLFADARLWTEIVP